MIQALTAVESTSHCGYRNLNGEQCTQSCHDFPFSVIDSADANRMRGYGHTFNNVDPSGNCVRLPETKANKRAVQIGSNR